MDVRIVKTGFNTYTIWNDDVPTKLRGVHSSVNCAGRACVIHNPTEHHMRDWPLHWRNDRAIFERICEHGIGHYDPDQFDYWRETGQEWQTIHGCDGDCVPSCKHANEYFDRSECGYCGDMHYRCVDCGAVMGEGGCDVVA